MRGWPGGAGGPRRPRRCGRGPSPEGLLLLVAGLARALFVLIFVPPALTAVVGEVLGRRGLLWYGGGCGLLTAALPWLVRGPSGRVRRAQSPPRRG
ncbi:hypothetical protein ACFQFG_28045 [Methylobacterium persicinum]